MRNITKAIVLFAVALATAMPAIADTTATSVAPRAAWATLVIGNRRFVSGRTTHPDQSITHRQELAGGQHPIAIVVGCSDSRVSPELVFDQGLGDLFVIRVAGNVVGIDALGSIEYAVQHLGVRLIVVLGHEKCGAVAAAVASPKAEGHVNAIVAAIQPAVARARTESGDLLDNAVRENVKRVVLQINRSQPIISKLVGAGTVKVIGARYDLDTGRVQIVR